MTDERGFTVITKGA